MKKLLYKMLGIKRIVDKSIEFKWGYIAIRPCFEFIVYRGTYFDNRYAISIGFLFGYICVYLPIRTRLKEGCDMPQYGIQIHSATFWIHLGGEHDESIGQCNSKWITWELPFFNYIFDNHWILNTNKEYQLVKDVLMDMKDGSKKLVNDFEYKFALRETYPYTYTLKSGEQQKVLATVYQSKRQWHRKWFRFLKKYSIKIEIEFSEEIGERVGSWKGGVVGTSFEMRKDESMYEALKRCEKERKFN